MIPDALRSRLILLGQRHSTALPPWIRSRLRRVAGHRSALDADRLVDDWSDPSIVTGRSSVALATESSVSRPSGTDQNTRRSPAADRLRCVLITPPLDVGGMDEVVAALAHGLTAYGFSCAVLQTGPAEPAAPGRIARKLADDGIAVIEASDASAVHWLRDFAPDVASIHGGSQWAIELAAGLSIPCVETLHGVHTLLAAAPHEIKRRNDLLSGVVAVSELVREEFLRLSPDYSPDRAVTIPNGVDFGRRTPPPREQARRWLGAEDEYVFVCLARHCLQKNTYGLVSAFGEVAARHPEAHLVVAGQPEEALYVAQVARLRETLPSTDRIHLRGHLTNPSALLGAADGFVLNSFFEGWALASMEALYAGVPAVLADVGGAREQLHATTPNGILVANPLGDPWGVDWPSMAAARFTEQQNRSELVEAMSRLIVDRDDWAARGPAISAESARRFRPELAVERHAFVLRSAARDAPIELSTELAVS